MGDVELFHFLVKFLKQYYVNVLSNPFFYVYAIRKHPFCLVAHIDTVRAFFGEPEMDLVRDNNIIFNRNGILGADDRAGIFGILKIIQTCASKGIKLPSVLFTNYEECGALGAMEFISDDVLDHQQVQLFIALDRQGGNQYVYYSETLPVEVKHFVEHFGYKENIGTYSDIAELGEAYGIPGVNLSIGYDWQHTALERLHILKMLSTILKVVAMLQAPLPFQ